jgi:AraC-like DNA-binding protein
MAAVEQGIPARYYAHMVEALQALGVEPAPLLEAARIRPQQLKKTEATLSLAQVERLVAEALRITRRSDLALDFGRAVKLSSHTIVGYAILSSPDFDYALRLAARHFRLIMPAFRMRYRRDARHVVLSWEPALPMSHACLSLHIEAIASATHFELRELLRERLPDYQLQLSIAAPPHAKRYRELTGATVSFERPGGPGLSMIFPARVASLTLPLADESALRMAESRCSELVRSALAGGKVADWVRMMLREASGGMPSLTELAHTLNLSARTLDRYLGREGASFRELSRRARHDKAKALLGEGRLSVTQVALELGYTDAANFTRAFRREARVTPSAHRERISRRRRGAASTAG